MTYFLFNIEELWYDYIEPSNNYPPKTKGQ